jgi:hypothetical protein
VRPTTAAMVESKRIRMVSSLSDAPPFCAGGRFANHNVSNEMISEEKIYPHKQSGFFGCCALRLWSRPFQSRSSSLPTLHYMTHFIL